jgi:hypothetical protein
MTNQDELAAQQCEDAAMQCLRTALGFENQKFHVIRLEVDNYPDQDGVMIGISFSKLPPDVRDDLDTLLKRVIQICKTA